MNLRKQKDAARILRILDNLPTSCDPVHEPIYASPVTLKHCESAGKLSYESEDQCRNAIKRRKQRGANTSFLRPYPCEVCHGWHMTSRQNHRRH